MAIPAAYDNEVGNDFDRFTRMTGSLVHNQGLKVAANRDNGLKTLPELMLQGPVIIARAA
jgi:hypothetical protein